MNYGMITKYEAGTIYRAMKESKINVLPETINLLYDLTKADPRTASQRYSQDHLFYDRISDAIEAIRNGNYEVAQQKINENEADSIRRAGKKSSYFKYQKIEEE